MLVEFRVKNFRSIRDEQVLSMVASKDGTLQAFNLTKTGIHAAPSLLNSAAIYGANASGKTSIIKAINFVKNMIAYSTTLSLGQEILISPFLLDNSIKNKASEFEITFIFDKERYQYSFSCTQEKIISEALYVYKTVKPQMWFSRQYNEDYGKYDYKFGPSLKGEKKVWSEATRNNVLFFSQAVDLNSEQLKILYEKIISTLFIVDENLILVRDNKQLSVIYKDSNLNKKIKRLLNDADIQINEIEIRQESIKNKRGRSIFIKNIESENTLSYEPFFKHVTDKGSASFHINEESTGTQNYFLLINFIEFVLQHGVTLFIDELDTSLHPLLVRKLVALFHDPLSNPKGAQLIFTTHDTSLLSTVGTLFRRDQIWFVDKDRDQASSLYSLVEFSPRKDEPIEKGYFQGRFGGLPFIAESGEE